MDRLSGPHAGDLDSAELLRGAAAGGRDAWAELVRRYTPVLRSRIRAHRLQEADAFDVAQTAWLRLAEHIGRIHTPTHLAAWLATVVSRECLRVIRERGRTVPAQEAMLALPDPDPGPEQRAVDRDVHQALYRAVEALPPRRRELVVALFAAGDRPYAQISRELAMPTGSIGPTRARTLEDLRWSLRLSGVAA